MDRIGKEWIRSLNASVLRAPLIRIDVQQTHSLPKSSLLGEFAFGVFVGGLRVARMWIPEEIISW